MLKNLITTLIKTRMQIFTVKKFIQWLFMSLLYGGVF